MSILEVESSSAWTALETTLSVKTFSVFAEIVTRELGIQLPETKQTMLQGRLTRRLRELQLASFDEYLAYLRDPVTGPQESILFADAVTTNKTDFFREPEHFFFLVAEILQEGYRPRANAPFRIWSAGCSSGEEAWSLAMTLEEYAVPQTGISYSILGTDISTKVLRQAQTAIYSSERVSAMPKVMRKYLLRAKDPSRSEVRIVPELRTKVKFRRLNFMDISYPVTETFHAVFFRNVAIYFDKPTQAAVVNKLCRNLASGGYFFIGHSESLTGLEVPLRQVAPAVFRRI